MQRLFSRRASFAALVVTAAVVVAGCGSSSSHSSSGGSKATSSTPASTGTSTSSATSSVAADFTKYQTPTGLEGLPKIGKPIPTGKTIDFVICGPAECVPPATDFTQAAKLLGWTVKTINGGIDPASNQAAMAQTVRDHPSAVIFEGLDSAVFQPQLAQLKAAHIPIIAWQTTDKTVIPTNLTIPGPSHYALVTKMMAVAAMQAANGKPNIGFIAVPAFPIYANTIDPQFKAAMKALCASCPVHEYDMPVTSLGKDATARAVNFVRANPGINVLIMDQDSVSLGLQAQLASAGLSNVKDIGLYPSAANLPNLTSGAEFALIPDPYLEMAYLDADALARIFTGQSPAPDIATTAPAAIWTKSNVPSTTELKATLPSYLATFKALWGK
jgi:ABC-type sugar transport system substrate-binding protein